MRPQLRLRLKHLLIARPQAGVLRAGEKAQQPLSQHLVHRQVAVGGSPGPHVTPDEVLQVALGIVEGFEDDHARALVLQGSGV